MDSFFQDIRHSLRSLLARPLFTGVAALTVAVGVGSATAIFSVLNGVVLKPFPFPQPEELVVVWESEPGKGRPTMAVAGGNYADYRDRSRSFAAMAAFTGAAFNITGDDQPPERVFGASVAADYFRVLGVDPALGRVFRPEENQGAHNVVILSHGLWAGRFGGDPEIVGTSVLMDGVNRQIVGVLPPLPFPLAPGGITMGDGRGARLAWVPLDLSPPWMQNRSTQILSVLGRLEAGVELERAQAEMATIASALEEEHPEGNEGVGVRLVPLKEQVVGRVQNDLWILLAAVGLVLVVACVNLTNLLLARTLDREKELAVRLALGADRLLLVRHGLLEAAILAVSGGVVGVALAVVGTRSLLRLVPESLPRQTEVGVDLAVLGFAVFVTLLASLMGGLIPSIRVAWRDLQGSLKVGGREGTSSRSRTRISQGLVISQLALAVVLMTGSGLLIRSFQALNQVDAGFDRDGILVTELMLPSTQYTDQERVLGFYDGVLDGVGALPGVTDAAVSYDHPLQTTWFEGFRFEDRPEPDPGEGPDARFRLVDAGYIEAMDIDLVAGRTFSSADRKDGAGAAVVNRAFVRKYLPAEDPLGIRIRHTTGTAIWRSQGQGQEVPTSYEIVGVVDDVSFNGLKEPPEPAFYLPLRQFPYWHFHLLVRHEGPASSLVGPIRAAIWSQDPNLPVPNVESMEDVYLREVAQDRFNALLLTVFALAALLLASGGTFGVMAYAVARRKGELGIRLALGADTTRVLRLVLGEGLGMAAWGLALGMGVGAGLAKTFSSALFNVRPLDPFVLPIVAGILLGVVLLSLYLPARRAAGTDPMVALRAE